MKYTYLDASAIVKLARVERETLALRGYLRRRRRLITSALARTEVLRALLRQGPKAVRRGQEELTRVLLVRVRSSVLDAAGLLLPLEIRSLDAIHLATALELGEDLGPIVTYDDRMAEAARALGLRAVSPA